MPRPRPERPQLPQWAYEESQNQDLVDESGRVLEPIREVAQAKQVLYQHAEIPVDEVPWYEQKKIEPSYPVEEVAWHRQLMKRLSNHLADLIYIHGASLDVDRTIGMWLEANVDFNRAIVIGLINEGDVRSLLSNSFEPATVNTVANLIFKK